MSMRARRRQAKASIAYAHLYIVPVHMYNHTIYICNNANVIYIYHI